MANTKAYVVQGQSTSDTSTFDIVVASGVETSRSPTAAVVFMNYCVTLETQTQHAAVSIGITDFTTTRCWTMTSEDNVGSSDSSRRQGDAGDIAAIMDPGTPTVDRAFTVSAITGGVRMTPDASGPQYQCIVWLFFGTAAKALVAGDGTGSSGSYDLTHGFTNAPKLGLAFSASTDVSANNYEISMGIFTFISSTIKQRSLTIGSQNAQSEQRCFTREVYTDRVAVNIIDQFDGTAESDNEVTVVDATKVTVDNDISTQRSDVHWLLLELDDVDAFLDTVDSPTTTSSDFTYTGAPWKPQFVGGFINMSDSEAATGSSDGWDDAIGGQLSVMAFDSEGSMWGALYHDEQAASTTNCNSMITASFYMLNDVGDTDEIDMGPGGRTLESDGFKFTAANVFSANGTIRKWPMFFIQESSTTDVQQEHWRFATPITGGAHEAYTLVGSEDTSLEITIDDDYCLIIKMGNDGTTSGSINWQLEYNVDGGGWNNVDGSSSNVRSVGSGDTDDATSTTERLTTSSRTFANSQLEEVNGLLSSLEIIADRDWEFYYAITFRSADLSGGETVTFRVTSSESVTFDVTPTVTIPTPGVVLITGLSDTTLYDGQTGVIITGSGFEATQNSGFVKISDTDSIDADTLVTQTVTSWASGSITITADRIPLQHTDTLYLFVENDSAENNDDGETMSFVNEDPIFESPFPSVTSQTSDSYTIGATTNFDATVYIVAVILGATAPDVSQIKLGNDSTNGPALGSSNKAFLKDTPNTITVGSLILPIHDLYVAASNGDGDSAVTALLDEQLDPDAGKQFISVEVKEVVAANPSNPCRIGVVGHGFQTGQLVRLHSIGGMIELNDGGNKQISPNDGLLYYKITVIDSNTMDLDDKDATDFTTYTSGGFIVPGYSVFENALPNIVDNDIVIVDTLTNPDSYAITVNPDGTLFYAASSDLSRQDIDVDVYDASETSFAGVETLFINNVPPALSGGAIPDQIWQIGIDITDITLSDFIEDFESDAITYQLIDAPPGVVVTSGVITGNPTADQGTAFLTIIGTDIAGDTFSTPMNFSIEQALLVADVIGDSVEDAREELEDLGFTEIVFEYQEDSAEPVGTVLVQDPVGGTVFPSNDDVTLTISRRDGWYQYYFKRLRGI